MSVDGGGNGEVCVVAAVGSEKLTSGSRAI
jgi:hypothetical protein